MRNIASYSCILLKFAVLSLYSDTRPRGLAACYWDLYRARPLSLLWRSSSGGGQSSGIQFLASETASKEL